jgi:hypothetical protein
MSAMSILAARNRLAILSAVILVTFSACQQNSPGDKNLATDKNPMVSRSAARPLVVDEIRVGASSGGTSAAMRPQTPKDPINVVVKTTGASQGTFLEVNVFDLKNGQVVANETRQLKVSTPTVTDLLLKREAGWSPGRHLVEVKIDGKLVGQRDIDVVDMPAEAEEKK